MGKPLGKATILVLFILFIIAVLITAGVTMLYIGRSADPLLAQSVQDEYSVPIYVKIVNTSSGNVAYIIPGEVKWDSKHERLLYNLSNPKETALGFIEALSNSDAGAIDFLASPGTRESWANMGYDAVQALEMYRSEYIGIEKPFIFDPEHGEQDVSEGKLTLMIISESGTRELDLYNRLDGTWKI